MKKKKKNIFQRNTITIRFVKMLTCLYKAEYFACICTVSIVLNFKCFFLFYGSIVVHSCQISRYPINVLVFRERYIWWLLAVIIIATTARTSNKDCEFKIKCEFILISTSIYVYTKADSLLWISNELKWIEKCLQIKGNVYNSSKTHPYMCIIH